MNANELADELQKMFVGEEYDRLVHEIPDLLRQQQAEIDRLTMLCDCMTTESNRKGNEIEELKAHPVKELPNNHQYIAQLEITVRNQQAEIEMLEAELKAMREQLNANQV